MGALPARLLLLAILSGGVFIVLKAFEYNAKIQAGITLLTNDFFMFYFVMTFMHFLHVVAGLVLLFIACRKLPFMAGCWP